MTTEGPKYKAIMDWVLTYAQTQQLTRGSRLPSENEMAAALGASRQTVRHAIDILVQQGRVTRVKGSGTYLGETVREAKRARCGNIAVISTYLDSYIFPSVIKGIEKVLSGHGSTMQIAFTGNRILKEEEILKGLLEKDNIDGLIVEPSKSALPNANLPLYRELMKRQIPILFFHSSYPGLGLPCVATDDREIGRQAVLHLAQAGHRRIGAIFKCDDGQGILRYEGFVRGMKEAGLRLSSRNVVWVDTDFMKDMGRWQDYLLDRIGGCTGLVCYNDQIAYRMASICRGRRISLPGQLSLVGVDNLEPFAEVEMKITSFPHPKEELGKRTAENMIHMIEDPSFDGNYLFSCRLEEGESVKRLV